MALTLAEATEMRQLWLDAYKAISTGKNYSINTGGSLRTLTRQDVDEARREFFFWDEQVDLLGGSTDGSWGVANFLQ